MRNSKDMIISNEQLSGAMYDWLRQRMSDDRVRELREREIDLAVLRAVVALGSRAEPVCEVRRPRGEPNATEKYFRAAQYL